MSSKKNVIILALVTAVVAAAAALTVSHDPSRSSRASAKEEAVAPQLAAKLNELRALTLSGAKEEVHLAQDAAHVWRVKEMAEYPADREKIRQLLYRLATSRKMEMKTSNLEALGRLSLSDRKAHRLRAFTAAEEAPLLDLLTGSYDSTFKGTYIRSFGENQSWLVSEDLTFPVTPLQWVDPVIVNVDRGRVWRVRLEHQGQPPVEIVREKPESGDFMLKNIAAGKELAGQYEIYTVTTAFEGMKLAMVTRAERLPDAVTSTARMTTLDGLEVQVEIAPEKVAGQHWVKFSARYAPESLPKDLPQKKPEEVEKVKQEAAAINARTAGWIYKLADFPYKLLMKKMDDLTRKS